MKIDPDTLTLEERRAKRQERREKQRVANVERARKMHAARLAGEADGSVSLDLLPPQVNVGCSGWYYWHWKGKFYPEDLPRSEWFDHYAERFDTVELNAPFYSWPTLNTVKTWSRQAGERNFNYTIKVSELITHVKRFVGTKTLVKDFGYIADLLAERMGCFLYQLPPSYDYTASRLKSIVGQLDPRRRNVVEFRHRSWWNETVFNAFTSAGVIFCSSSGPRLPDELVKTADEVYVRFHGVKQWYRHDYTDEELSEWARRISSSGATRVWAYFNNDRDANAIKNATSFRHIVTKSL